MSHTPEDPTITQNASPGHSGAQIPGSVLNKKMEQVAVTKLKVSDRNPNTGDIPAIVKSIRDHGFYNYVIADRATKEVLVGNHRLQAAIEVGLKKIPCIWVEVDRKTANWLLAKDNEIARFGWRDERTLYALLTKLEGLEGTGYTIDDQDDLMVYLRRIDPQTFAPKDEIEPDPDDKERYTDHGQYYISLDFAQADYPEAVDLFDRLMTKHQAESYAEAWLKECEAI